MSSREVQIDVEGTPVSASIHGRGERVIVLGHGAGGNRRSSFLLRLAGAVAESGRCAVLYNFPYTERGGRRPDPPHVLEAAVRALGEFALRGLGASRLVHGGKSMGGRIASQAAAAGARADGLAFLGYPLHPPGRPHQMRDRHLDALRQPMLFVQGTRDAFARWDLLEGVLARLGERASLHRVESGDHSFRVLKSARRTEAEVEGGIAEALLRWLDRHDL